MSSTYTVKKGDCLYNIAKANEVTLGELLAANPNFTKKGRSPELIYPGETVIVPKKSKFCSSVDLKKGKAACPLNKTSTLSEKEAQEIFDVLAKESHIPYDYPVDCCFTRAHEMCRIMKSNKIDCRKYWLFDKNWGTSAKLSLTPKKSDGKPVTFPDSKGNQKEVKWVYHVAPTVKVKKSDGTIEDYIIDPSISDRPLPKDEWRKIMDDPVGSYTEESGSDAYFQNQKYGIYKDDPNGDKTKTQLKIHRANRDANLKAAKKAP